MCVLLCNLISIPGYFCCGKLKISERFYSRFDVIHQVARIFA